MIRDFGARSKGILFPLLIAGCSSHHDGMGERPVSALRPVLAKLFQHYRRGMQRKRALSALKLRQEATAAIEGPAHIAQALAGRLPVGGHDGEEIVPDQLLEHLAYLQGYFNARKWGFTLGRFSPILRIALESKEPMETKMTSPIVHSHPALFAAAIVAGCLALALGVVTLALIYFVVSWGMS